MTVTNFRDSLFSQHEQAQHEANSTPDEPKQVVSEDSLKPAVPVFGTDPKDIEIAGLKSELAQVRLLNQALLQAKWQK